MQNILQGCNAVLHRKLVMERSGSFAASWGVASEKGQGVWGLPMRYVARTQWRVNNEGQTSFALENGGIKQFLHVIKL
jgi:hypothetical protein